MTTVLYVDDSHLGRTLARLNLTRIGCEVIEAADGVAALAAASSLQPDCIVLCAPVPAMELLELVRKLRDTQARSRIVVLATRPRREMIDTLEKLGVAATIERHDAGNPLVAVVERLTSADIRSAA